MYETNKDTMKSVRALSVRLPDEVYEQAKLAASESKHTLNEFIAESVRSALRVREERALYDAFTLLGQSGEEAGVDFALGAQKEIVLGGD